MIIALMAHSSTDPQELGARGDFFGGVVNPFVAAASFLALLYTINVQLRQLEATRDDLKLTRDELELTREATQKSAIALDKQSATLEKQNISRAFFDLFEIYKSSVSYIESYREESKFSGKASLATFSAKFYKFSSYTYKREKRSENDIKKIAEELSNSLGQYFRVIYRIIDFLSEKGDDGKFYIDIFRAQLTKEELYLIYFNCITDVGKKMIDKVSYSELFDNLPIESGYNIEPFLLLFPEKSFGKNNEIIRIYEHKNLLRQKLTAGVSP